MSLFRRRLMMQYRESNIDSQSLIRPCGVLDYITVTGGSDELSVMVGNTANFTKPTKIVAHYLNNNTSTTLRYKGFTPTITSSNTNIISVGTIGAESCTLTAKSAGSATVSVYIGNSFFKSYDITVTNAITTFDVTGQETYSISNDNIEMI